MYLVKCFCCKSQSLFVKKLLKSPKSQSLIITEKTQRKIIFSAFFFNYSLQILFQHDFLKMCWSLICTVGCRVGVSRWCFFAVWQVACMSALLCDQTMGLQEEKVNTNADWLAREATSWLLGSGWVGPREEPVQAFGKAGGRGGLSPLS